MASGEIIRSLRKERGYTVEQLARRTGLSLANIKKIEAGKNRLNKIKTLQRLAKGLSLGVDELLLKLEGKPSVENALPDEPSFRTSAIMVDETGQEDEIWLRPNSPEAWIVRGDSKSDSSQWSTALKYYRRGLALLPKNYQWAKYSIEKVAQMHINQNEHLLAQAVIVEVERIVREWEPGINHDLILGFIAEKRGWIETYSAQYNPALAHFNQALVTAQHYGDIIEIGACHHMIGRTLIDQQMSLLYPELFDVTRREQRTLQQALWHIQEGDKIRKYNEWDRGLDAYWEGMALLTLGKAVEAKESFQRGEALLQGSFTRIFPLVALNRIETWEANYTKLTQYKLDDLTGVLDELLASLSRQAHPYAYVRTLIAFLCVRYQTGYYKHSRSERKRCIDLCLAALLLHPEQEHAFFSAATELLKRFIQSMSPNEFAGYIYETPFRISSFLDEFRRLKSFPPTWVAALPEVETLIKTIGKRQGKY
jgi:transcriptional regulator with XRE-family HTH domain